ncbi:hypothetical protein [Nonomuraea rubra]|uniref:hypothetical protein n=1 Tax=Nonomuraea rubra TaxID=46180 RepID=UPI0033EE6F7E
MGKYDGMDPQLVRDLLTEVKHAATEMRRIEDRVRAAMQRAGVPTEAVHRPAQVADAVGVMVKDVDKRLAVLEKREDPPGGDAPKDVRGDREQYENPRGGSGKTTDGEGKTGSTGSDGKTGSDGSTGSDGRAGSDGKTGSEGKTGSDGKTCDDAERSGTGRDGGTGSEGKTGDQPAETPKDDDVGSRRDQGTEPDRGVTDPPAKDTDPPAKDTDTDPPVTDPPPTDPPAAEPPPTDSDTSGRDTDAPAADGSGGQDATKPRVVVVDGVKVLQVPLDAPQAAVIEDMLENPDQVQPAEMPKLPADGTGTTNATNVNDYANDGSDVVSAEASPPDLDALKTVIEDHRQIAPQDMPGVQVPEGEYGKGAWAERDIRPDGPAGSIDAGNPSTGGNTPATPPPTDPASTGGTATAGGSTTDSTTDSTTVGSTTAETSDVATTPGDDTCDSGKDADTPPRDDGTGRDSGTPPRDDGTGGNADTPPRDDGTGRDAGTPPTDRDTKPDQPTGDRPTGDQPTGDRPTGDRPAGDQPEQGRGGAGEPVAIPPTNPAETPTGNADTPPTAPETGQHGDTEQPTPGRTPETGYGAGQPSQPPVSDGAAVAGGGAGAAGQDAATSWADDGSDVVTSDTTPPTLDALRTVMDHHRDIQPQDMPSVQIPPGEYGKGEWVPEDVGPDGPPGAIDPGRPERSQ